MDRLDRFSIPGITFFVVLFYFIYALTGENIMQMEDGAKDKVVELKIIIPALFSTPLVGLALTSILHFIIHTVPGKRRPGPYWFYLPRNIEPQVLVRFSNGREPETLNEWRAFYLELSSFHAAKLSE